MGGAGAECRRAASTSVSYSVCVATTYWAERLRIAFASGSAIQQLMTVYADLRREIQFQSRQIYAMRTETRRLNSQVSRMYADLGRTPPNPMRLAGYGP